MTFDMGGVPHAGSQQSPCLFNLYAEYIVWNTRLDEAQAGIKTAKRNINNFRYADDTTLMAESKEELKRPNDGDREKWKSWFKIQHSVNEDHGIWSHHFMANRWGKMETVKTSFLGSKIT